MRKATILFLALACVAFFAAQSARSQFRRHHLMLIVSKGLPGVTIYDADSEDVVCRAKTEVSPHEAAFSIDGHTAFVPIYGSSSVGQPGTNEHYIHFISTSDCKDNYVLDTGRDQRLHGIVIGISGNIYVTAETSKSVLVVNSDTHKVTARIPTGSEYSRMLVITRDEAKAYVSNVASKTLSVLDIPGRKLSQQIPTNSENQRVALSPDQHWLVTNLGPDHKVAFYRTADNQLDFSIPVDGVPFTAKFASSDTLFAAGTQDGKNRVWKIDPRQKKVLATTTDELGTSVGSLAVNPFNGLIYVSDQDSSKVAEVNPATMKVEKRIYANKTPDCIVFKEVQ
jgi:YVTN family beta-propeller protein